MRQNCSEDYRLPGIMAQTIGNAVLCGARLLPRHTRKRILERHTYYQTFSDRISGDQQGVTKKKWDALGLPTEMTGKSVIDIGCAEGFFCLQAAKRGAGPIAGIDSQLGSLLCARVLAMKAKVKIKYRLGVFPSTTIRGKYDYVLCLSVLHHLVSTKDIWRVLTQEEHAMDRQRLVDYLRKLRNLTSESGYCVVEMPYEYDSCEDRKDVDPDRMSDLFVDAGFMTCECRGTWDHRAEYQEKKDRFIYVAQA